MTRRWMGHGWTGHRPVGGASGGRQWRSRLVALGAVAAVAVGCGTTVVTGPIQRVTTAHAVGDAFAALGREDGLTVTVSLGVTSAELRQVDRTDPGADLPAAAIADVPRTSLVFDLESTNGTSIAHTRFTGSHPAFADAFGLDIAGATPVQVRNVGGTLYARADIPALLESYGRSPSDAARVVQDIERANAQLPGAAAFARGQWVSVDLGGLAAIEKRFASMAGGAGSAQLQSTVRRITHGLLPPCVRPSPTTPPSPTAATTADGPSTASASPRRPSSTSC
jgi:hypothetical protein